VQTAIIWVHTKPGKTADPGLSLSGEGLGKTLQSRRLSVQFHPQSGQILTTDFQILLPYLSAGSYSISPAVAQGDVLKHDMCDWVDNALVFSVQSDQLIYGTLKMDVDVKTYVSDN
jgi:hypothetical protein